MLHVSSTGKIVTMRPVQCLSLQCNIFLKITHFFSLKQSFSHNNYITFSFIQQLSPPI